MSQRKEPSLDALKNESARQRWELFHRAIATAKRSNASALQEAERAAADADARPEKPEKPEPQLSLAR